MTTKEKVRKITDDPLPPDEDKQSSERVQEDEIVEEADGAARGRRGTPRGPSRADRILNVYKRTRPADVAIVALLASTRRMVRQMGDDIMAEFTKLDAALEDLSAEITKVADQISGIQVEDPAVQAKIDAAAEAVTGLATRVDELVEEEGEDTPEDPDEGRPPSRRPLTTA